jgi:hypothetical protein
MMTRFRHQHQTLKTLCVACLEGFTLLAWGVGGQSLLTTFSAVLVQEPSNTGQDHRKVTTLTSQHTVGLIFSFVLATQHTNIHNQSWLAPLFHSQKTKKKASARVIFQLVMLLSAWL